MDVFDDFATDFYDPFRSSYSFRGRLVDEDEFDIVPKKNHYERLIREKQEAIDALEREHENAERYYKTRKEKLKEEKETLLRDRDNKNKKD